MIELLAGIGVGGGVAVVSGFAGNILGFARGRAEKNIAALFTTGQSDALWCTCGHAMSFHSRKVGSCSKFLTKDDGKIRQDQFGYSIRCECNSFVGDPSKNPAPTTTRGELDLG